MAVVVGSSVIRRASGETSITYDLRVEFTTDDPSPVTNPYVGEVGQLTIVETDGALAASGGNLVISAPASAAFNEQGYYSAAGLARVAGRALMGSFAYSDRQFGIPFYWSTAASLGATGTSQNAHGFTLGSVLGIDIIDNAGNPAIGVTAGATSTTYTVAIVLRGTGAFYFIKGGVFTSWSLVWVSIRNTTTPLYPAFNNAGMVGSEGRVAAAVLSGVFASDFAAATQNVASPSGTYIATADQHLFYTATAPGSITQECGQKFRVVDASNYLWAGFTTAGRFQVRRYTAGSPTNLIDVASVITGGATVIVHVFMRGNTIDAWTYSGTTLTKRGTQQTEAQGSSATDIATDNGDWTVSNLRSFPYQQAAYALQLDRM